MSVQGLLGRPRRAHRNNQTAPADFGEPDRSAETRDGGCAIDGLRLEVATSPMIILCGWVVCGGAEDEAPIVKPQAPCLTSQDYAYRYAPMY